MAWIPKGSIRTHTGDDQAKGATLLKDKKRYGRQSSKLRFAPNHQIYWPLPSSFTLQMPHMHMFWNSSLDMLDYSSHSYLVLGFHMDHLYIIEGYHQIAMHIN
jgi:hypothetical protein